MDNSEYSIIGILSKLQGYKGEFLLISEYPLHKNLAKWESVFLNVDGLLVPFFIHSLRIASDNTAIIGFDRITSTDIAKEFLSCKVYQNNNLTGKPNQNFNPEYFKGYKIIDNTKGDIGKIDSILNYNNNILFRILSNNREILVPAAENCIIKTDRKKKEIIMQLPDGLLDIF